MAEVDYGSWLGPVFGLWLKWVVGCQRSPVFGSGEVMVRSAWVMVRSAWVIAWLAGSSGFPMGFFFFFFNMGFSSGAILVSSRQWWLGFF